MIGRERYWVGMLAIGALFVVACGGSQKEDEKSPGQMVLVNPSTSQPSDELERAVLAQLADLTPDTAATIQGHKVVASAPYSAASGRVCRAITIAIAAGAEKGDGPPERHRLVCRMGSAWSYVPNAVRQTAGGSQ